MKPKKESPLTGRPVTTHYEARRPMHAEKPLLGERILITRAREQADKLTSALEELGAKVIEIPAIEIRPPRSYEALDAALKNAENYDWLILTSVNGVHALFDRLSQLGLGIEKLLHLNIAAIGPATRAKIEEHGLPVDVVPEHYVAESVVAELRDQVKGKRVLLVRARVARDVIPEQLRLAGAKVHVMEAYETVVPESSREKLQGVLTDPRQRPTAITFTSSSTAHNFVELVGSIKSLERITIVSIGPVTSATLRELGLPIDIEAAEYTIPGIVEALVESRRKR